LVYSKPVTKAIALFIL